MIDLQKFQKIKGIDWLEDNYHGGTNGVGLYGVVANKLIVDCCHSCCVTKGREFTKEQLRELSLESKMEEIDKFNDFNCVSILFLAQIINLKYKKLGKEKAKRWLPVGYEDWYEKHAKEEYYQKLFDEFYQKCIEEPKTDLKTADQLEAAIMQVFLECNQRKDENGQPQKLSELRKYAKSWALNKVPGDEFYYVLDDLGLTSGPVPRDQYIIGGVSTLTEFKTQVDKIAKIRDELQSLKSADKASEINEKDFLSDLYFDYCAKVEKELVFKGGAEMQAAYQVAKSIGRNADLVDDLKIPRQKKETVLQFCGGKTKPWTLEYLLGEKKDFYHSAEWTLKYEKDKIDTFVYKFIKDHPAEKEHILAVQKKFEELSKQEREFNQQAKKFEIANIKALETDHLTIGESKKCVLRLQLAHYKTSTSLQNREDLRPCYYDHVKGKYNENRNKSAEEKIAALEDFLQVMEKDFQSREEMLKKYDEFKCLANVDTDMKIEAVERVDGSEKIQVS